MQVTDAPRAAAGLWSLVTSELELAVVPWHGSCMMVVTEMSSLKDQK